MKVKFVNCSVGYGKKIILENLNIEFDLKDSVCLLGPNGIGKTTIFKTLLGHIPVIKGQLLIDDKPIDKYSPKELSRIIAYVPQAKDYSYQFTVFDVVLMGRASFIPKFSSPRAEDVECVEEALKSLDILHMKDKVYSELSGGEQQIVLVARALVQKAKLIIMDEPASNLDFSNQEKLLRCITGLSKFNTGVFMSSHIPDHAFICSEKVLLVNKDKSYCFGCVDETITKEKLSYAYQTEIEIVRTDNIITCGLRKTEGKNEKN